MKLGVCVPYRNREAHLKEFIPRVGKYLEKRGIDYQMYFAHQDDDKLFNRGATKNIAAKHAFEDGCDYIVWHDIDMIPEDGGGADYSFPYEGPRHIATKISQMDYKLKYYEYFGGAVIFSKEHVEKTNGYSNEYWDWGMEDDDLFWRCYRENLTSNTYLELADNKLRFLSFNGKDSSFIIPFNPQLRGLTSRSHTISILCRPKFTEQENTHYLIGDKKKQYVEHPIFRIPGYDYGISFNNSRAISLAFWNSVNEHNYMWAKRYENQWCWVTAALDIDTNTARLFMNGQEIDDITGQGSKSPMKWHGRLKNYGSSDLYIGCAKTSHDSEILTSFFGDIGKVLIWNSVLTDGQIENIHNSIPENNLVVDYDFNKDNFNMAGYIKNTEIKREEIHIVNSILPYRVDGRMMCLPHKDEGIVDGEFVKGDTTAANERRYILKMQKGKIDYKKDGINNLDYNIKSIDKLTPKAKMINITL